MTRGRTASGSSINPGGGEANFTKRRGCEETRELGGVLPTSVKGRGVTRKKDRRKRIRVEHMLSNSRLLKLITTGEIRKAGRKRMGEKREIRLRARGWGNFRLGITYGESFSGRGGKAMEKGGVPMHPNPRDRKRKR